MQKSVRPSLNMWRRRLFVSSPCGETATAKLFDTATISRHISTLNNVDLTRKQQLLPPTSLFQAPSRSRWFHATLPHHQEQEAKEYSTPELTQDAALHKTVMEEDQSLPSYQNPLVHERNKENPPAVLREDFATEEEFQAAVVPAPPLTQFDEDGNEIPPIPEYLDALADEMVHLTVLEMNELVNKMADHFGFHEGMMSPDGAGMGVFDDAAGDAAEEAAPAKTTFDVKLTGFGDKAKIKVIKEVRSIAGLGLKEAKEFVEGAPGILVKDVKQEAADEIKAKLEAVGGTVEIV